MQGRTKPGICFAPAYHYSGRKSDTAAFFIRPQKKHPASNFLLLRPCVCTTWERTKSNNRDDNYLQLNLSNKSKLNNNQCFLTLRLCFTHFEFLVAVIFPISILKDVLTTLETFKTLHSTFTSQINDN